MEETPTYNEDQKEKHLEWNLNATLSRVDGLPISEEAIRLNDKLIDLIKDHGRQKSGGIKPAE